VEKDLPPDMRLICGGFLAEEKGKKNTGGRFERNSDVTKGGRAARLEKDWRRERGERACLKPVLESGRFYRGVPWDKKRTL